MALAEMSATNENTVSAIDKAVKEKLGVYAARAHDPDYPNMGRILKSRHARSVCCGIATPVAKKAEYSGLKFIACHSTFLRLLLLVNSHWSMVIGYSLFGMRKGPRLKTLQQAARFALA
jgi:hypothetical protein